MCNTLECIYHPALKLSERYCSYINGTNYISLSRKCEFIS